MNITGLVVVSGHTYWSTRRLVQDHIGISYSNNSWSPINFIASDKWYKNIIIILFRQKWKREKKRGQGYIIQCLPRKAFRVYMHTQISSRFNKLIWMGYPESLLCLTYSFSFNGSSLSQNWRSCNFFICFYLLRCGSRWWLWTYQSIINSSKVNEIGNISFNTRGT